jgi:hypothetical protein
VCVCWLPVGQPRCPSHWFGDVHQAPGICEVPHETFSPALDRLSSLSEHLAVMGVSQGVEAALLLASRDARIRAVAALSPSSVVWANVGPGIDEAQWPLRSSRTEGGEPLPFVPYNDTWLPPAGGRRNGGQGSPADKR